MQPKYQALGVNSENDVEAGTTARHPWRRSSTCCILCSILCVLLIIVLLITAEILTIFVVPTPPGGLLGFCIQTWTPPGGPEAWQHRPIWHAEDLQDLLSSMSLKEKIAQMLSVEEMQSRCGEAARLGLGSVMWGANGHPGQNTGPDWRSLMQELQKTVLGSGKGVPLLYAIDSVHGNSHVKEAVMFPHNIGLGSTRNASLVEAIGEATAIDSADLGFSWLYAPCVAVVHDVRWGRTFESFSQDPVVVASLAAAYVKGVKRSGRPVLTTAKHYIGDGASRWGTGRHGDTMNFGIDRGDATLDKAVLEEQLQPFRMVTAAGVESIMVSYGSVNGSLMHRHAELLSLVRLPKAKGGLGFEGFLVSDYGGVDMLASDYAWSVEQAVNAGIDVIMVTRPLECGRGPACPKPQDAVNTLEQLVGTGRVRAERVEEAAKRILAAKLESGLLEHPLPPAVGSNSRLAHRALARNAAAQSVVLLQNRAAVLPLPAQPLVSGGDLCLAGAAAIDLGLQCGGWTLSWQGRQGTSEELGTTGVTLWDAAQESYASHAHLEDSDGSDGGCVHASSTDIIIAVIAEDPYAEYMGDVEVLQVRPEDALVLDRVASAGASKRKVLISLAGRPLPIDRWLKSFDAVLLASLPGTEGGLGIWDVLVGATKANGRLPFVWPREGAALPMLPSEQRARHDEVLFPLGFGLSMASS